nr:immunoglobulin light chain junction region [Macaca mulatta]
CQQGKTNPFTF